MCGFWARELWARRARASFLPFPRLHLHPSCHCSPPQTGQTRGSSAETSTERPETERTEEASLDEPLAHPFLQNKTKNKKGKKILIPRLSLSLFLDSQTKQTSPSNEKQVSNESLVKKRRKTIYNCRKFFCCLIVSV